VTQRTPVCSDHRFLSVVRAGRLLCRQRHHALESPGYQARPAEPTQPQL
ncbi:hypothetical protein, partial [Pseudomonas sp. FEN]